MKETFIEIPADESCPCGSGRAYRRCCKRKRFKFGYSDGIPVKQVKVSKDLVPKLKEMRNLFRDMYGRYPSEGDFVFSFSGASENDAAITTVRMLRDIGMPENKIYAHYRSGGLMPCSANLDAISDVDLKEYADLCHEYDEAMARPLNGNTVDVLQFIAFANQHVRDTYESVSTRLGMTLYDYINRHNKHTSSDNYAVKTIGDYCAFLAMRTIRTLEGIHKLHEAYLVDGIYALARGLFESYMYIDAIGRDQFLFSKKIALKADTSNYTFAEDEDGITDYKRVIHNETGKTHYVGINLRALQEHFTNTADTELYKRKRQITPTLSVASPHGTILVD